MEKLLAAPVLVYKLSQKEFEAQLNNYTYGQNIRDITSGYHADGVYGGGYYASGKQFGYELDYRKEDGIHATYTTKFYAKVEPSGLVLPCGIEFEDSLSEVLQKLGVKEKTYKRYVVNRHNIGALTLYADRKATMELKNNKVLNSAADDVTYDYQLLYT